MPRRWEQRTSIEPRGLGCGQVVGWLVLIVIILIVIGAVS